MMTALSTVDEPTALIGGDECPVSTPAARLQGTVQHDAEPPEPEHDNGNDQPVPHAPTGAARRYPSRRQQRDIRVAEKALSKVRLYTPSALTSAIAHWELGPVVAQHIEELARFALDRQRVPASTDRALALRHFARTILRDTRMNVQWELDRWQKGRAV